MGLGSRRFESCIPDTSKLNPRQLKLGFIVIFVRDLKAISGSSRQFDSVVPGIEPMKHVDLSDAVNVAV